MRWIVSLVALVVVLTAPSCFWFDTCCVNVCWHPIVDTGTRNDAKKFLDDGQYADCVRVMKSTNLDASLNKLQLARCHEEAGEREEAIKLYEAVVAKKGAAEADAIVARDRLAELRGGARAKSSHVTAASKEARPPRARTRWPLLAAGAKRKVGGGENDAAVIVGIGDYYTLPKIAGAAENAADWYVHLTTTLGVPAERVTLLRNNDATRETIEQAVERAAQAVPAGGRVWFIFIGHGAPAPTGDDGLLLGADTQSTENSLEARGLPQKRVLELLQRGAAGSIVAAFDACFSGTASDGKTPLVEGSQATLPVRRVPNKSNGSLLVMSSSERVAGALPHGDRPAFSYLMLGALRGWADDNKDGVVTAAEAHAYVDRVLKASVHDRDQTPRIEAGDPKTKLAVSAAEPPPDLVDILTGVSH